MYSQNREEEIIVNYFGAFKGNLLDIGANDGVTLSNSRRLMELGWDGIFVEPSPKAYEKLEALYPGKCVKAAISDNYGTANLLDSDSHLSNDDSGLLSTLKESETKRWNKNKFESVEVETLTFPLLLELTTGKFDFITIDAEGMDFEILSQIDLKYVGCRLVCVEHNGKDIEKFKSYCEHFNMKEIHRNAENLIMGL